MREVIQRHVANGVAKYVMPSRRLVEHQGKVRTPIATHQMLAGAVDDALGFIDVEAYRPWLAAAADVVKQPADDDAGVGLQFITPSCPCWQQCVHDHGSGSVI